MIARRPGGLQTTNYSLPPTFKVREIQPVSATPLLWKAPSVGVQPKYSGTKNLMDFPNLAAAGQAVATGYRRAYSRGMLGQGYEDDTSPAQDNRFATSARVTNSRNKYMPRRGSGGGRVFGDDIDPMGDPGMPGPLNPQASGRVGMTADEVRGSALPKNNIITRAARELVARGVERGTWTATRRSTNDPNDPLMGPTPF